MSDLFVVEAARRAGVARPLLPAAALAKDTGAACLRLSAAKTNGAARAFYSAAGWQLKEFDSTNEAEAG